MPRAPDGTYNLPSGTLVSAGDVILPSQHNPAMQDIAQGLSNSLDRNGAGSMRAPLNMGGFPIQGLGDGSQPTDAATISQMNAAGMPLGVVFDFWGSSPPANCLFCYGQELLRADYPELFAVIGTNAGPGNGSTTFNLPDYRGRVGAGRDDMGGVAAGRLTSTTIPSAGMGIAGGLEVHQLTIAQIPAHNHTVNDPGHTHSYQGLAAGSGVGSGNFRTGFETTTGASPTGISINNTGGSEGHNNVQPTIICNKIMRVRNA